MVRQSHRILLLEPAYKNKFPPLGLMKISAYHKLLGDTVLFRKILPEELGADIYSFPMRYQPIDDPEYFDKRTYTGPHWSRKFIRAVQNLLICTSVKVGQGLGYFEHAFGRTPEEFMERLWEPEAFLRHREYYAEETAQRRAAMARLTPEERTRAERIISLSLPGAIKEAAKQEESQRVRDSLYYYFSAYGDGKKLVSKEVQVCPA